MSSRRKFVSTSALLGLAGMVPNLPFNLVDKFLKSSPVLVTFKTGFPVKLTPQEFDQVQRKFVKYNELVAHTDNFRRQGKIVSESDLQVFDFHSVWQMKFDSYQSYAQWDEFAGRNKMVDDDLQAAMGYTLKVSVEYV